MPSSTSQWDNPALSHAFTARSQPRPISAFNSNIVRRSAGGPRQLFSQRSTNQEKWYFALIFPRDLGLDFATVDCDYWTEYHIWEFLKLIPFEVEIAEAEGEGLKEDEPSDGPTNTVYDVLLKNRDLWDVVTSKWEDLLKGAERDVDGVPAVVRLVLSYCQAFERIGKKTDPSVSVLRLQGSRSLIKLEDYGAQEHLKRHR